MPLWHLRRLVPPAPRGGRAGRVVVRDPRGRLVHIGRWTVTACWYAEGPWPGRYCEAPATIFTFDGGRYCEQHAPDPSHHIGLIVFYSLPRGRDVLQAIPGATSGIWAALVIRA